MPTDRSGVRRACRGGAGWLAAVLAIALFAPASGAAAPGPSRTRPPTRLDLWRSRSGDDPRWASPSFDDSGWRAVPLLDTWQRQGYRGGDGVVWFRRTVELDPEARLAAGRGR